MRGLKAMLVVSILVQSVLAPPAFADFGGSTSSTPGAVLAWVLGSPGGGVGGVGCSWSTGVSSRWVAGETLVAGSTNYSVSPPEVIWVRDCGGVRTLVWVPVVTPEDLARVAGDLVRRLLPVPVPLVSPSPAVGGVVNLEEWLAVAGPGVVSASAATPAVSVTVSAVPVSTRWDLGNGDVVSCAGLGVEWVAGTAGDVRAPCGYTWSWYSKDRPGDAYQVSVSLVWAVSWRASSGESGVLADLSTVSSFAMRVGEYQTVMVAP